MECVCICVDGHYLLTLKNQYCDFAQKDQSGILRLLKVRLAQWYHPGTIPL